MQTSRIFKQKDEVIKKMSAKLKRVNLEKKGKREMFGKQQ